MIEEIKSRMRYKNLGQYACKDEEAIMLEDENEDIRPRFFRDADSILHSLS